MDSLEITIGKIITNNNGTRVVNCYVEADIYGLSIYQCVEIGKDAAPSSLMKRVILSSLIFSEYFIMVTNDPHAPVDYTLNTNVSLDLVAVSQLANEANLHKAKSIAIVSSHSTSGGRAVFIFPNPAPIPDLFSG